MRHDIGEPLSTERSAWRVLVTGATGFVGRHVVQALVEQGAQVRAVAHRNGHEPVVAVEGIEVCYADVTEPGSWQAALEGVDAVIHLVAIIRERGDLTFDKVNHQGTAYVVAAARQAGVRCFVHLSAIGSKDDPKFPYLQSKARGEQAVIQSGIPCTLIRGSILFGQGDEFINTLAGVVRVSPLVPVAGDGKTRFQPMHVQDMARCLVRALELDDLRGQTIEIGGPAYLTYEQIMGVIARTYGGWRRSVHVPMPVMRRLVWVMEKTMPHPPATTHQLSMLAFDNIAQLDTVERVFGFTPRPLEGNIDYVHGVSFWDAVRIVIGFMPRRIRDH
ncbi:MAG: complex I NDUFA9 subunit family protein [Dehalococcoidia bacterium]|nr:complex I NDUFA9 subunit family protein [Dehalococcoidia bacterium]